MPGRMRHASWNDLQKILFPCFSFFKPLISTLTSMNIIQLNYHNVCFVCLDVPTACLLGITVDCRSTKAIYTSFPSLAITPSTRAAVAIARARTPRVVHHVRAMSPGRCNWRNWPQFCARSFQDNLRVNCERGVRVESSLTSRNKCGLRIIAGPWTG